MPKPQEKEMDKLVIEPINEEAPVVVTISADLERWTPKTEIGRLVKARKITTMDEVLDSGKPILEPEIVDYLLPGMDNDLLMIGQSKGKFGGGSRRVFRQTQKKTQEGNKPKFSTCSVIGNKDGYVGIGFGKAKETVPAREKALRNAKLNMIKVVRGSGSWESDSKLPHSIPFAVKGKCSSVTVELYPAPRGTGIKAEKEVSKILKLAGIQDVWSKTRGQTRNKINVIRALIAALKQLNSTKHQEHHKEKLAIHSGMSKKANN